MAAKRALLIGINTYPLLPAERQLGGCVNDALLMQQVLIEQFGFPAEQITLLTQEQATRDAILRAFTALTEATAQDDVVVIFYAGHGSQMTDLEGDEPTGYDSTMMPCDSAGWSGQNRDITDDEISVYLDALGARTSYITLIFDCCHSGTITRDVPAAKVRAVPRDERPRDVLASMRGALPRSALPATAAQPSGPSGWIPLGEKYVMIAGCRDLETSFEYFPPEAEGKVSHGALTYFLTQQLKQAAPGTTYRDVFERAAARVTAYAPTQHPQMEGKGDREVFGVKDIEPMRFVRVQSREGGTVTLAAGVAHGMTSGSRFAIHAPGTKVPSPETLHGEVEITSVNALSSEARISSEPNAGTIQATDRAFEVAHAFGDFRLRVSLAAASPDADRMRDGLSASPLIQLGDAAPGRILVTLLPARDTVAADSPVPRAGPLSAPMWAVTGATGDLIMPLKPVSDTGVVIENIEKLARFTQGLNIENPDANSALRGKFSITLMRRSASGELTPAAPETAGGLPVYEDGEVIVFRITSDHDQPAWISLVDFCLDGSVELLLPWRSPDSQIQLRAGRQFDYETSPSKLFRVSWPEGFPYVPAIDPASDAMAIDTLKLFVTERETDFSALQQQRFRGAGSPPSPLGTLLHRVFEGSTRNVERAEPVSADWTTVTASFAVRRKSAAAAPSS